MSMCEPISDEDTTVSQHIAELVQAARISEFSALVHVLERLARDEQKRAEADLERARAGRRRGVHRRNGHACARLDQAQRQVRGHLWAFRHSTAKMVALQFIG